MSTDVYKINSNAKYCQEQVEKLGLTKKEEIINFYKKQYTFALSPVSKSARFSDSFFEAVKPLVSIVSSGDENEMKEYIHPRATLMGALGKHSRIDRP